MTDNDLREYPCVKVDGTLHITVDGSRCACGMRYEYAHPLDSADTLVVPSPLLWRTISEVSCRKCRETVMKQENQ